MKTIVKDFDTIGEYVNYVLNTPQTRKLTEGSDSPECGGFYGRTNSLAEAAALVERGWPEGAAKVSEWSNRLDCFAAATAAAKSKAFNWDVTGDFVDVGKYMTGEPECFGSEDNDGEQSSSRVVSIRINACVSGALQADAIVARGVAVLVAVDVLESLGRRCEILVSQSTHTGGHTMSGSVPNLHLDANVCVKRAGEPVDLDRLAFAVAHPAFFRRLGFKFMELNGHSPSGCNVWSMSDKGKRPGVIEVDELVTCVSLNQASLQEHVLEILKSCGVEFTNEQLAEIAASAV